MRPALAPSMLGAVVNERLDEPVRFLAGFRVLAIENDTDNVVYFPHPHGKVTDEVETGFFTPLPAHLY